MPARASRSHIPATGTCRFCIFAIAVVMSGLVGFAQPATTVFRGRPEFKVGEGGIERLPEQLQPDKAVNLESVVSRIGESYYWASRGNVEMVRLDGGAFITYVALNGAGYIRVIKPELKKSAAAMGATEERFDYVEHALIGLRSVTYYGQRR